MHYGVDPLHTTTNRQPVLRLDEFPPPRGKSDRPRPPQSATLPPKLALVLCGGGLKGFAHIGVLNAFEERGIVPTVEALIEEILPAGTFRDPPRRRLVNTVDLESAA
jgi:hypothetical protein